MSVEVKDRTPDSGGEFLLFGQTRANVAKVEGFVEEPDGELAGEAGAAFLAKDRDFSAGIDSHFHFKVVNVAFDVDIKDNTGVDIDHGNLNGKAGDVEVFVFACFDAADVVFDAEAAVTHNEGNASRVAARLHVHCDGHSVVAKKISVALDEGFEVGVVLTLAERREVAADDAADAGEGTVDESLLGGIGHSEAVLKERDLHVGLVAGVGGSIAAERLGAGVALVGADGSVLHRSAGPLAAGAEFGGDAGAVSRAGVAVATGGNSGGSSGAGSEEGHESEFEHCF